PLLAPAGRILLSIPNVSYAGVIGGLLNGEFQYRSEGLLDATHLRFFTRKSLLEWIDRCDLAVTEIDTVGMPLTQSEFAAEQLESLPPAVLRTLLGMPDALTYQFIVEVVPAGGERRAPIERKAQAAAFTFLAQLFFRTASHPFDQARSCTVHGEMGVERQRLRFAIPPSASDLVALRLDPTNRPGFLRVFGMSLFAANGECVWRWDLASSLDRARGHELQFVRDAADEGVLFVCEGDDPWLELPVAVEELAPLRGGGALELELSWPQSPDSYAVIRRLLGHDQPTGRVAELTRLNGDMRAHIRTLSVEIKELQTQLRAARAMLAEINQSLTFRLGRPLHKIVNLLRRT
ncbi:MAG TPA: glycosyl transferase, partial [Polyangia bacterium]